MAAAPRAIEPNPATIILAPDVVLLVGAEAELEAAAAEVELTDATEETLLRLELALELLTLDSLEAEEETLEETAEKELPGAVFDSVVAPLMQEVEEPAWTVMGEE